VPFYITAADLCLLPERVRTVEISPLKLFEYLACARPVVAFDVPGLALIEELGVGRLVPAGDAVAMATAIRTLLADNALRRQMGSKGREFVERERSWRGVAERVSKVLGDAVAST
jgi:glycosyltransferase involved in cell wall biosynthesis